MKHTKGPWAHMVSPSGYNFIRGLDESIRVAELSGNDVDEATEWANAKLIECAPEMLDLLKDCLRFVRSEGIDSTLECALEKVIKKAGGDE